MGIISCFLYVYLGPQNSKYTFKNKQAINGNNIHDMQLGRQEVNGEIEDIRAGGQRAERASSRHTGCAGSGRIYGLPSRSQRRDGELSHPGRQAHTPTRTRPDRGGREEGTEGKGDAARRGRQQKHGNKQARTFVSDEASEGGRPCLPPLFSLQLHLDKIAWRLSPECGKGDMER